MTNYPKNVENPCITFCKSPCKLLAKLCANPPHSTILCVKPLQIHHLPALSTPPYPQPPTSSVQLFYPLFHQAYYYNYK